MDNSIESQNVDRMVITTFGSFLANSLAEWSKQVISLVQADSFKYIGEPNFFEFLLFFFVNYPISQECVWAALGRLRHQHFGGGYSDENEKVPEKKLRAKKGVPKFFTCSRFFQL